MWNVPLTILRNIKKIIEIETGKSVSFTNYCDYIETLDKLTLSNNNEVKTIIDNSISCLNDKNTDYHIMKIENLFSKLLDKHEPLTIAQKISKILQIYDFEILKKEYLTNVNKQKKLLLECIKYVYVNQTGKFAVLKYGQEVVFYDLWNEFYLETRGLIIDMYKMQLVSSPYRKFFNLNEKEYTQIEKVKECMDNAIYTTIGNKEDGSMIGATVYEDEWIIHTGGMIDSLQSIWAKKYMFESYKKLIEDKPQNLTFLFEAEYPENRIVVDYGDKESLILTGIRNNLTGRLLIPEAFSYYAKKYELPTPEMETKDFFELIEMSKDTIKYPADKKEGWVILMQTANYDLQVKLKCDDYCAIHHLINKLSAPKIVFNHIITDKLDDLKSKAPEVILIRIEKLSTIIFHYIESKRNEINAIITNIPDECLFSSEEVECYNSFIDYVKILSTKINDKLSSLQKNDIETAFIKKANGKEIFLDKWAMKEFDVLWNEIPENIKNQKAYNIKKNNIFRFSKSNKYQKAILDYSIKRQYDINDFLNFKEIVFCFNDDNEIV